MSLSQDPSIILKFVKIVERYPDIYDSNSETYRKYGADKAWAMVVECLKTELNVECTVDELKLKWKGIRSSYSRYKSKLYHSRNSLQAPKKYYLCDALSYLDPFTKPKSIPGEMKEDVVFEDCDNNEHLVEEDIASSSDFDTKHFEWSEMKVQPTIIKSNNIEQSSEDDEPQHKKCSSKKPRKRKYDNDEVNEDLQFFKSILPDIENFSPKEKRMLKIGVLELINKIENDRTIN